MASNLSNVIDYCRVINGSKGFNNTKTQFINEITQDYNMAREDTVYRFDVLVNSNDGKDVYVNDSEIPIRGVIDISRKQTADTEMEERLQVYPNQIKRGDYVKFKVNETDTLRTYLIKSKIDKKHGYDEGIFEECNYILKWMIDGVLYSMPAIVTNNTKYTLGIKNQSSGFTEGSGMFGAIISYNDIAKMIPLGKRFIVNGQAWEATQLDHSSVPNVLSILLGETSKVTENDNLDLEIADYYQHKYTITLISNTQSVVVGGTFEINPMVKDNGKEVGNDNVKYSSSDTSIATVDSSGKVTALKTGTTIITCSIGEVKADLSLSVIAKTTTPVISYNTNWTNNNGSLLRLLSSSNMVATKLIDNIEDTSLVIAYTGDATFNTLLSQKKISITKVNDRSYTIKNTGVNTSMTINITFTDSVSGVTIETKIIQLKGV